MGATHPALAPYFHKLSKNYPRLSKNNKLINTTPSFFTKLQKIIGSGKATKSLQGFAFWQLLQKVGHTLGKDIDAVLDSFQAVLRGVVSETPQPEKCMKATLQALWGYTDRMFVERAFGAGSQAKVEQMVNNIKEEFAIQLQRNTWMDKATQQEALRKLKAMNFKIGAPVAWPSYDFEVGGQYFSNYLASVAFSAQKELKRYDQKVDLTEWSMNPSAVNAYYSPGKNEMVFPAGILQLPFFSPDQPVLLNYAPSGSSWAMS